MSSLHPLGSTWCKWDLHVHTPLSIVQGYGGNKDEVWEKFIQDLESLPSEFKVIGINDYIFLDGYKKVLEFKQKGRLQNIELILPVIELRLDKFGSLGEGDGWKKVNFHIIFSDSLQPEIIETHFLNAIQHGMKIEFDENPEEDYNEIVSRDSLEKLGKKIKASTTKIINDSDLKTGFNSLTFNFDEVRKKLKATTFKDSYLTAIGKTEWDALRWDGSAGSKKTVINTSAFVFTALEKSEDYEKQKNKLTEQGVNDRLLDCSDAHDFSDSAMKDRIGNCFTWLKANPTFEGLKQVSKEATRIFIGEVPPLLKRVKENPTKYIKKLHFAKLDSPKVEEIWFENAVVPINSGLVAIIGNKGNGKSALSDSIGLVGNTQTYNDFSFLSKSKFRSGRPNKSECFDAILTWETDAEDSQNLSKNPIESAIEKVKYIPQGFLEKLCNENHENFEEELRNVIFTHIPDPEKFGQDNLRDLEHYKTETIKAEIDQIASDLRKANETIVFLERKDSEEYLKQVEAGLAQKETELDAHQKIKPIQIDPPSDPIVIEKNKQVSEDIDKKREHLADLEKKGGENSTSLKALNISVEALNRVLGSLGLVESQAQKTISEIEGILVANDIKVEEVIDLKIDRTKINSKISGLQAELESITKLMSSTETEGIPYQIAAIKTELLTLQGVLDEPSKKYQKYLDELRQWERVSQTIIGNTAHLNSLEYFKSEKVYIEEKLQEELSTAIIARTEIVRKIFRKKLEILQIFQAFYKPITEFISSYGGVLKEYEIRLDIENKMMGFEDKFFNPINAGAKGSFLGVIEGREKMAKILEKHDWSTEEGMVSMLDEIILNLKSDSRPGMDFAKRDPDKQIKGTFTIEEFYNVLFGLEYLEASYKLKLNDKNISELSPGERGALLLIFYLALDQNDIPLVIDQPEENLDNQSVFKLLAQFIKKAKNHRQIIIVTHNPNLAVVCDADQIIHIKIEKHNKNKILINSGALEDPLINRTVVDILEGTYEAFDTRETKYKVIPRTT